MRIEHFNRKVYTGLDRLHRTEAYSKMYITKCGLCRHYKLQADDFLFQKESSMTMSTGLINYNDTAAKLSCLFLKYPDT